MRQFIVLSCCLAAALLLEAPSYGVDKQSGQSCRGDSEYVPASQAGGAAEAAAMHAVTPGKPHSIRLSWNPSVPASASPQDSVKGYNIYRRQPGKQYEKINVSLIHGTACTDFSVDAGQTYYYQTNAVSTNGAVSGLSQEVKANVPAQ